MTILEEFKKLETSDKKIKEFGLFVGLIFSGIAGLLLWKNKEIYIFFLGLGLFLIGGAFFFKSILRPIYKIWMGFALVIGFFMSKIILGALYFFVMTPISFIAKITKTKFLKQEMNSSTETYWNKRDSKPEKKSYSQQY